MKSGDLLAHRMPSRAHFVIVPSLGGTLTGDSMARSIIWQVAGAGIAGAAFGCALEDTVAASASPGETVAAFIRAVP
jgi:hypothetical protein